MERFRAARRKVAGGSTVAAMEWLECNDAGGMGGENVGLANSHSGLPVLHVLCYSYYMRFACPFDGIIFGRNLGQW